MDRGLVRAGAVAWSCAVCGERDHGHRGKPIGPVVVRAARQDTTVGFDDEECVVLRAATSSLPELRAILGTSAGTSALALIWVLFLPRAVVQRREGKG